jgi:hypothetical protein
MKAWKRFALILMAAISTTAGARAAWQPVEVLAAESANLLDAAMAADGSGAILFHSGGKIWLRHVSPAAAWGAATALGTAHQGSLATGGGSFLAAWMEADTATARIVARSRKAGTAKYGKKVTLAKGFSVGQPVAGVGPDGTLWVLWKTRESVGLAYAERLYAARRGAKDAKFSAPVLIATIPGDADLASHDLAVAGDGSVAVLWLERPRTFANPTLRTLRARLYAKGKWQNPTKLADRVYDLVTVVAAGARGDVLVGLTRLGEPTAASAAEVTYPGTVQVLSRLPGAGFGTPVTLDTFNYTGLVFSGDLAGWAGLAVAPDGSAMTSWVVSRSGTVSGASAHRAGPLGSWARQSPPLGLALAADGGGGFVGLWDEQTGRHPGCAALTVSRAVHPKTAASWIDVGSFPRPPGTYPCSGDLAVAAGSAGRALAVWSAKRWDGKGDVHRIEGAVLVP